MTIDKVKEINEEIARIFRPHKDVWFDFSGKDSHRGEILEEKIFDLKKNNNKKADFHGVELKTAWKATRLLSYTPPEKKHWMRRENILTCTKSFLCTQTTNIQGKDYTTIVNREARAIQILDENGVVMSLPFDILESRLANKISNLAHFSYNTKKSPLKIQYTNVTFYTGFSFDTFLDLFEKGIIKYELRNICDKKGNYKDKGAAFTITGKNLSLLYKEVYEH